MPKPRVAVFERLYLIAVDGRAVTAADLRREHTQSPIRHEVVTVFAPNVERALQWFHVHFPEVDEPQVLVWELDPRFGHSRGKETQ